MAVHQGFDYEVNASNFLKGLHIVPKQFNPAGASHDQPDLLIKKPQQKENQAAGCELKITAASAGSLVLKYDTKTHTWGFNEIPKDDVEKKFIRDLAINTGALKRINQVWKKMPHKFAPIQKFANKEKMYRADVAAFKEVNGDIPAMYIEKYYLKKNTHYLNVGTHGLYVLGGNDPIGLNKGETQTVPRFGRSVAAKYRARVQYKGGGNYQFTFEMSFGRIERSPYNIAPISGAGNVKIDKSKVKLDCFL